MSIDIDSAVYLALKDNVGTINTSRGDAIALTWIDRPEESAKPSGPYGSFAIAGASRPRRVDLSAKPALVTVSATDNPTFNAGTSEYTLTQQDVAAITQVSGTLASSPHVFVEDVDYELASIGGSIYLNAIRWLAGGDEPDDATSFQVDYTHNQVQLKNAVSDQITYRLILHAMEHTEGSNFYPKSTMAHEMKQSIYRDLTKLKGSSLGNGLVAMGFNVVGSLAYGEGESVVRIGIDLRVGLTDKFNGDLVGRAGQVGTNLST